METLPSVNKVSTRKQYRRKSKKSDKCGCGSSSIGKSPPSSSVDDDEVYYYKEGDHDMTREEHTEYCRQFSESEGFGVVHVPNSFACGMLTMLRQNESVFRRYSPYAALAIHYFNKKKKTNFELRGVERVNWLPGPFDELYITFQATEKDAADVSIAIKTFQAKVINDILGFFTGSKKFEILIDICRFKPSGVGGGSSKGCEYSSPTISESSKQVKSFDVACIPDCEASAADSVSLHYSPYATLAIKFYSQINGKKWEFKAVEKVDEKSTEYDELVITFQATEKDAVDPATATKTFEAKVIVDHFRRRSISDDKGLLSRSPKPRITFEHCILKTVAS